MISAPILREYLLKLKQKLTVPLALVGVMALFMTVAMLQHTSRISQLEKRAINKELGPTQFIPRPSSHYLPGAVYTHWGKKNCTAETTIEVYAGVVAGQHFTHIGGGSNLLCVTLKPEWGNYSDILESAATIYGVEYEMASYKSNKKNGMFINKHDYPLHNQNVPCVVCETRRPASVIMIPGQRNCYNGWTIEYWGYLMAGHYNHKGKNQYICVDKEPAADQSGHKNEDGSLLYHVQGVVGSLPGPPYVNYRELTCVVCSKSARYFQ